MISWCSRRRSRALVSRSSADPFTAPNRSRDSLEGASRSPAFELDLGRRAPAPCGLPLERLQDAPVRLGGLLGPRRDLALRFLRARSDPLELAQRGLERRRGARGLDPELGVHAPPDGRAPAPAPSSRPLPAARSPVEPPVLRVGGLERLAGDLRLDERHLQVRFHPLERRDQNGARAGGGFLPDWCSARRASSARCASSDSLSSRFASSCAASASTRPAAQRLGEGQGLLEIGRGAHHLPLQPLQLLLATEDGAGPRRAAASLEDAGAAHVLAVARHEVEPQFTVFVQEPESHVDRIHDDDAREEEGGEPDEPRLEPHVLEQEPVDPGRLRAPSPGPPRRAPRRGDRAR